MCYEYPPTEHSCHHTFVQLSYQVTPLHLHTRVGRLSTRYRRRAASMEVRSSDCLAKIEAAYSAPPGPLTNSAKGERPSISWTVRQL